MKNTILKLVVSLLVVGAMTGCGKDYLKTDYNTGLDVETGLNTPANIGMALNGAYFRLYHYTFCGNYAITIGDLSTDVAHYNFATSHWSSIYTYALNADDSYLLNIWNMGYKTADNSARVLKAINQIYASQTPTDQAELDLYAAEAHALRGLAQLYLVNIFGTQVKVNGTDNSDKPGIVIIDQPVAADATVSRATVGKCYEAIVADFTAALDLFTKIGGDREESMYLGVASTKGLLARTYLYLERFDDAKKMAQEAVAAFASGAMIYDAAKYKAMFQTTATNSECLFHLAIDDQTNWSANSSGTLWTTYGYQPSGYFKTMIKDTDCRKMLLATDKGSYAGGKFLGVGGNTAVATHFMIRLPEMYLIIAESELRSTSGVLANAQAELLKVAKRNSAITKADDLGTTKDAVFAFLKDERAREFFQEGHRLYDLRRWGMKANVYSTSDSQAQFKYTNYEISKFVYPIPNKEVNAGFGVAQTPDWSSFLPK